MNDDILKQEKRTYPLSRWDKIKLCPSQFEHESCACSPRAPHHLRERGGLCGASGETAAPSSTRPCCSTARMLGASPTKASSLSPSPCPREKPKGIPCVPDAQPTSNFSPALLPKSSLRSGFGGRFVIGEVIPGRREVTACAFVSR